MPLFWAGASFVVIAQEQQTIEVLNADVMAFQIQDTVKLRKLIGNVQFKQDSTLMFCDSAYHYVKENKIEAFSNVRILMSSASTLRADRVEYDGQTKIAELYGNIVLDDKKSKLKTPRMTYWRETQKARYINGGVLTDADNRLTSREGDYFGANKNAVFKHNVVLIGKDFDLKADSLQYNNQSKTATFICPTYIYTPEGEAMYTERGYMKTEEKQAFLYQNCFFSDTANCLQADTLFFDNKANIGWAKCNILMTNNSDNLLLAGEKGNFDRINRTTQMTDDPYLIQTSESDTLVIFADTLVAIDQNQNKTLLAYKNARITMKDVQARADSALYNRLDSILTLMKDPVLWSDLNQISGDTLRLWMKNKKADSMVVINRAMVVSQETEKYHNQIKGRLMFGKFKNNQLSWLKVTGNSESVYFVKDNELLVGMNRSTSVSLAIYLKENKPETIVFQSQPIATFYPMADAEPKKRLEGFRWRIAEKPKKYY